MNKMIKIVQHFICLTSVLLLSGCMTPGKNTVPHGDMTMAQIYGVQTGLAIPESNPLDKPAATGLLDARHYRVETPDLSKATSRDVFSTDDQRDVGHEFKLLPNPRIAVYIFPHMAHYNGTNVPVPGYHTSFFLYTQNHYAMPGEIY